MPDKSEIVLVTGGSGYIGGWMVAELLRRGHPVRSTLRDLSRSDEIERAVRSGESVSPGLAFCRADLDGDAGWNEAMEDVDVVVHVATPMGTSGSEDPEELIRPAVDGAARIMRAATAAGVRRVVMTSAANASSPSSYAEDSVTDETLWTDPEDPTIIPYRKAKTLAELTAWNLADEPGAPELTTILPGAVFGPILSPTAIGSVGIIARMLRGEIPLVPNIGLEVVDVRDLVDLHLRAIEAPGAAGQRFLGTGEFTWMRELAETLRSDLGERASQVSTEPLDDDIVRALADQDATMRSIAPALGRRNRHSTARAREMLGWATRPATQTILDSAQSLIDHDAV